MIGQGAVWAFLGSVGLRELVMVALVALVLYGRSGALSTRQGRGVRTGLTEPHRWRRPLPGFEKLGDRLFWFFTITAATAVVAWIVTRALIYQQGPG